MLRTSPDDFFFRGDCAIIWVMLGFCSMKHSFPSQILKANVYRQVLNGLLSHKKAFLTDHWCLSPSGFRWKWESVFFLFFLFKTIKPIFFSQCDLSLSTSQRHHLWHPHTEFSNSTHDQRWINKNEQLIRKVKF